MYEYLTVTNYLLVGCAWTVLTLSVSWVKGVSPWGSFIDNLSDDASKALAIGITLIIEVLLSPITKPIMILGYLVSKIFGGMKSYSSNRTY